MNIVKIWLGSHGSKAYQKFDTVSKKFVLIPEAEANKMLKSHASYLIENVEEDLTGVAA